VGALPLTSRLYVAAVTVMAAVGFVAETPVPILLAALLTLPASLVALPSYYLTYGLLAWITGANSETSSGYGGGSADGSVTWSVVMGGPPAWLTLTSGLLGVLALTAAAVTNAAVLQAIRERRQVQSQDERSRAVGT
jgi:hypothetical protein